jgi:hypothetical protein
VEKTSSLKGIRALLTTLLAVADIR